MSEPAHSAHEDHTAHRWLLGISAGIGVLSLAPYVLPAFGIGGADDAHNMMNFIGAPTEGQPFGSGIAGQLQGAFASIPLIGGALTSTTPVSIFGLTMASGALATIAATSIIGIGGALFANWLAKHEDPNASIHWSKIIRVAALATSMLIALPSVLGAISVAITFLASVIGPLGTGSKVAGAMINTLGATTAHAGAASGISTVLSHLISCGTAILPIGVAALIKDKPHAANDMPEPQATSNAPTPLWSQRVALPLPPSLHQR